MKTKATLYLALIAIIFGIGCSNAIGQTKHYIGEEFGGGIVFDVSADGKHGLIAETVDQGKSNWYEAMQLVKTGIHSTTANKFTDWRLPTKEELDKLYFQKNIVGGFYGFYWSATESDDSNAWTQLFYGGMQGPVNKDYDGLVRAVRAFSTDDYLGTEYSNEIGEIMHYIGEEFGGGIVFDVSADGQNGLIAETIDQGSGSWHEAKPLVKTGIYRAAAKKFNPGGWR